MTEPDMLVLAEAIAAAIYAVGAEPMLAVMTPRSSDGEEPPATVAAAMKASQVFFNVVKTSITHTRAARDAAAAGSRGMMMTAFTEEMLIRGGIEANFRALAPRCQAVAQALAGARQIRLTSPHGTDLALSAAGRRGNALTCLITPGQFTTVPTVEANVSPVEGSADGTIVADAGIPSACPIPGSSSCWPRAWPGWRRPWRRWRRGAASGARRHVIRALPGSPAEAGRTEDRSRARPQDDGQFVQAMGVWLRPD